MNNKTIIFSTIFFLIVSFAFLSLVEKNKADINNQNVWSLYFENPQSQALDFDLENHSTNLTFHWQLIADKTVLKEANAVVQQGEIRKIPVSSADLETAGKKIIISVTAEKKTKEIYKNF